MTCQIKCHSAFAIRQGEDRLLLETISMTIFGAKQAYVEKTLTFREAGTSTFDEVETRFNPLEASGHLSIVSLQITDAVAG